MDDEQILVQVTDRVMEITLNRPDRLNAWTPRLLPPEFTRPLTLAPDLVPALPDESRHDASDR